MAPGTDSPTVAVIGAGISGLTVAYELAQLGAGTDRRIDVVCLEASRRAGGNIRTEHDGGFVCEWGPNGFLDNAPRTVELARRLGLEGRIVQAQEAAAARFIYRKGKLRRVPTGAAAFLRSGILAPQGKLRLLAEPFVRRGDVGADESVFDFAARRIGRAAAATLVDAMVSGVYAGDAAALSLPATFPKMRRMEADHGSLFRAMLARRKHAGGGGPAGPGGRLTSFRDGLQELTDALARTLGGSLRLDCPVNAIADMGDRGFRILLDEGAPIDADAVVLACPASRAAALVASMDAPMASTMETIPSAPLAVVHFGYSADAVGNRTPGFGFLVPRGQGLRILGTLWSSHIFEGRAPKDRRLLTTMIGGAHDPGAVELEDRELIAIVRNELQAVMQAAVAPYFIRVFRHPQGIPQYTLGHLERLATLDRRRRDHAGLWISGNSYRGVSVNACVEEAPEIAAEIAAFLETRTSPADLAPPR